MLHADLEEWDEADEAYKRCLELCEAQGNKQMIANVLLNRSELSCARERYGDAVASCDLALSIYSAIGDEVGRGEAMRWKGHALRHMSAASSFEYCSAFARRSATSMFPCASVFTTTTRIPAITALAGFVPCADCGMRQTLR